MHTQAVTYREYLSSPCTGFVQAHRKKAQGKSQFSMKENSGIGLRSFQRGKVKGKVMSSTCRHQNSCKAAVITFTRGVRHEYVCHDCRLNHATVSHQSLASSSAVQADRVDTVPEEGAVNTASRKVLNLSKRQSTFGKSHRNFLAKLSRK